MVPPTDRDGADTRARHELPLPSPLSAVLELVSHHVPDPRRLRDEAVRLPMAGLAHALQTAETVRRQYATFAMRGVGLLRHLTGAAEVAKTAMGMAREAVVEDGPGAFRDVVAEERPTVEAEAREVAERARDAVEKATEVRRAGTRPAGRKQAAKPAKRSARPPAPEPMRAAARAAAAIDGSALSPDDLPLPDIDHLTLASLRGRLRRFGRDDLVQLLAYEKAHADRLQVVTMLENRIAKLEADQGQDTDSGGQGSPQGAADAAHTEEPTGGERAGQAAVDESRRAAEDAADDLGATPRP